MDITKAFIKTKRPCADGFRWYVRHAGEDSSYQQLLDALVQAGRVQDACWLLDQFGPTDAILVVDTLEAESIVFAGALKVRRGVHVSGVLRAGRGIQAGGGIHAGQSITVGADMSSAGAVNCAGPVEVKGRLHAAWSVLVQGPLDCEDLRIGGDLACERSVDIRGQARIGQRLEVKGALRCAKGLRVGGDIDCGGDMHADQGIEAGAGLQGDGHVSARWGIQVRGDLVAAGAIRVGEGLSADGEIRAGDDFGIYAGLEVRTPAWEAAARVHACRKPQALRSGWWAGPLPGTGPDCAQGAYHEEVDDDAPAARHAN